MLHSGLVCRIHQRRRRGQRCVGGRLSTQGIGAIRHNPSAFIDNGDDLELRNIGHRFHSDLQGVEIAGSQKAFAHKREPAAGGVGSRPQFVQVPREVEIQIQTIIKPRRRQSKNKRDERNGDPDWRRPAHRAYRRADRAKGERLVACRILPPAANTEWSRRCAYHSSALTGMASSDALVDEGSSTPHQHERDRYILVGLLETRPQTRAHLGDERSRAIPLFSL